MSLGQVQALRQRVYRYWRESGRHDLPWRKTSNPYRILLSEVMLQQTQVSRVLPKYQEFLHAFPSLTALAQAPQRKVLVVWQGLGYNRRALNLQRLAQVVTRKHHGRLPRAAGALELLPGLGPYTARAVACFAFNVPVALVETNIRKVIIHEFFARRRKVGEHEVWAKAEELLDTKNPREWNLALMDYGATQYAASRTKNPNQRSAIYTRQSKFVGSRRQVRGAVVRVLVGHHYLTLVQLRRRLSRTQGLSSRQLEVLPEVLRGLVREGFVVYKKPGRLALV